jgi:hypothetical protein
MLERYFLSITNNVIYNIFIILVIAVVAVVAVTTPLLLSSFPVRSSPSLESPVS